ncbi:MAG: acyltransferase [Sphingomonas sp.]|nr:acyltransferase [Sphingomonas sp.]
MAVVMVLFRHGERALQAQLGASHDPLQSVFTNGWIGVDLFFGLSGYLIARHLVRAGIGSPKFLLSRYLTLRALRILPAYYAVLILTVCGAFPLFEVPSDGLGVRVLYHLLFLQDYLPSNINVVFWSLGVEEKFYLIAPILILVLLNCRTKGAAVAVLLAIFALPTICRVAILAMAPFDYDYPTFWATFRSPFHMSLEGLAVGVGIALAEHAGLVRRNVRSGVTLLLGSGLALAVWMSSADFMATIDIFDVVLRPPLVALFVAGIVLGGVHLAGAHLPLARYFQVVAKLSYSLYLIHFPLIPLILAIALPFGIAYFWVAYLIASFAAAALLYHSVEKPFLLWKDRLSAPGRFEKRQPAVVS